MFQIDSMSRTPVYEQLVEQVGKYISAGILKPQDKLPGVRSLSAELSINPNTIQRAYGALDKAGLVVSVPGKGCFISEEAPQRVLNGNRQRLKEIEDLSFVLHSAGISEDEIILAAKSGIEKSK